MSPSSGESRGPAPGGDAGRPLERRERGAGTGAEARARILARVRSALEGRDRVPHPGAAPRAAGEMGRSVVELFASALSGAGGEAVHLTDVARAAQWLRGFEARFASARVGVAVPAALRPRLPEADTARADLGVSVAVAGAAATGTLILSSGEGRALQLLPPTHLVWVEARNLSVELEEALEQARRSALPAALALHSGPSKSADIGRIVVTGVHGPGRLVAAVVDFPLAEARTA